MQQPAVSDSLFNRLGGYAFLDIAVDRFYSRLLADPRVSTYFVRTDIAAQLRKQRRFLAHVFGGPHPWDGKSLRHVHRNFGIGNEQFDIVLWHMRGTLLDLGTAPALADEVIAIASSHRPQVVDEGQSAVAAFRP